MPAVEEIVRTPGSGAGEPWKVIVLNDNHNTFDGVARILSKYLPGVSFTAGMTLANKIDQQGSALVWSGVQEPAELYWEQLKASGLTMAPLSN